MAHRKICSRRANFYGLQCKVRKVRIGRVGAYGIRPCPQRRTRFVFTTKDLARRSRNQRRKGKCTAETRSSQSAEDILIKKTFTLRPPRPPRCALRKVSQAAQIVSYSNTHFSPDRAGEKRFACRRTAASGIRNISRKDAKAAKVGEKT